MPHRSGYKCILKKVNPTWFKKGHTPFFKGTKGIKKATSGSFRKGQRISIKTEFKSGQNIGKENINWKGNKVGYYALHCWVERTLGKPEGCVSCGTKKGRLEWANRSYRYLRDVNDWIPLCKRCHASYDKDNWGLATKIWKLNKTKKS